MNISFIANKSPVFEANFSIPIIISPPKDEILNNSKQYRSIRFGKIPYLLTFFPYFDSSPSIFSSCPHLLIPTPLGDFYAQSNGFCHNENELRGICEDLHFILILVPCLLESSNSPIVITYTISSSLALILQIQLLIVSHNFRDLKLSVEI